MLRFRFLASCTLGTALFAASVAAAAEQYVESAVSATVHKDYRRAKNRDGSFKTEHYAISYAGLAKGTTSDATIERVPFAPFDEMLKKHLASQNYVLAPNAQTAELLLRVNWGRTLALNESTYRQSIGAAASSISDLKAGLRGTGASMNQGFGLPQLSPEQQALADQAESDLMVMIMEDRARDLALQGNASLLGYLDPINELADGPARYAGAGQWYDDLRTEIADSRYYLVVTAYDFKSLQQKTPRALWVTRISIYARGNRFDEHVAAMAERMARYFGRKSDGLVHELKGTVQVGEAQVVGTVEAAPAQPDGPPAKQKR